MLISVWRKPGEKENFDKLLFAKENRCGTMIFATNAMLINILVSHVGLVAMNIEFLYCRL